MNFGEYIKKVAVTNTPTDKAAVSDNQKIEKEAEYTESSLFTAQNDGEGTSSIFEFVKNIDLTNVDFNKVLQKAATEETEETEQTTNAPAEPKENPEDTSEIVLREFFNIDAVKKAADADGDGEITEAEARAYLAEVAKKGGNEEELTIEDFNHIIEELGVEFVPALDENGELILDENGEMIPKPVQKIPSETEEVVPTTAEPTPTVTATAEEPVQNETTTVPATSAPQVSPTASAAVYETPAVTAPRHSHTHHSSGSHGSHSSTQVEHPQTIEEMEAEKERLEAKVEEKQSAVEAVVSGNNEKLKEAQKQADDAKTARDEALKNDKIKPKKLEKVEEEIAENQALIDENDLNISKAEDAVSDQDNTVKNMNMSLASLRASMCALPQPTGKEEDAEKDATIKEKKSSISKQIATKQSEISKAEKKLSELKENLEKLKQEKEKLEKKQEKLEEKKEDIIQKYEKKCSEDTKAAIDAYKEAAENVKTVKASELQTAKEELAEAKKAVTEITDKISRAKDAKVARENRVNTAGEDLIEYAEQYEGILQDEMGRIMNEKGYRFDRNLWCADFVSFALGNAYGEENLQDWYRNCKNRAYCPTVLNAARDAGAVISERTTPRGPLDTSNVKPGDICIFNWERDDSRVDHIGIVISVNDDGTISTIEGNTGGKGGSAVRKHKRDLSLISAFIENPAKA